jgi:oligopeptide transport system permease protein
MDTKDTRRKPQFASPRLIRPDASPPMPPYESNRGGIPRTEEVTEKKIISPFQESLRRLTRDKRAMTSLFVLIFVIVAAIIGPVIYTHIGGDYMSDINGKVPASTYHSFAWSELTQKNSPPSAMYWLGTDHLGRDMLARLLQGLQISLLIAVVVEIVDIVLGVIVGTLAGYYGGWIDQFLARFTDLMFAFPGLLFVILLTGIFGSQADEALAKVPYLGQNGNAKLVLVSLGLAFTVWPLMARYVRGQTLQIKQSQFIEAARTAGTTDIQVIIRHILPNLFNIVLLAATLNMVATIVSEAGISLLGLGVQPPGSSLGLMISDGVDYLSTFTLALVVLSFSFLGDGLRDAFDPRMKD